MNVLILGASGLVGNAIFRHLNENFYQEHQTWGVFRSLTVIKCLDISYKDKVIKVNDLLDDQELRSVIYASEPDVIVNCLSASSEDFHDLSKLLSMFSVFPQKLKFLCDQLGVRLIQISSDAVYGGSKGFYSEKDITDFTDDYGMSKFLGEVDGKNCLTVRSSFIGKNCANNKGLVNWFLAQDVSCFGYKDYIFSGLPVNVFAGILATELLGNTSLNGIYHIASDPISKYDLLCLIADVYGKKIEIIPKTHTLVDRSLNSDNFRIATGYSPPDWQSLVNSMFSYR